MTAKAIHQVTPYIAYLRIAYWPQPQPTEKTAKKQTKKKDKGSTMTKQCMALFPNYFLKTS